MGFKNKTYFLSVTFFVILMTIILYQLFDKPIAVYFYTLDNQMIKDIFKFLTIFGNSAWYFVPSVFLFLYFKKMNKVHEKKIALYIFMTNLVAGIGVWLFKIPFARARPKLYLEEHIYGFQWFEINPKFASFPSGHTMTIISTVVAFSLLFPKYKYIFLPLGALIAFSRVVVTAHYMSDVVFASFLGTLVAISLHTYYFKSEESS